MYQERARGLGSVSHGVSPSVSATEQQSAERALAAARVVVLRTLGSLYGENVTSKKFRCFLSFLSQKHCVYLLVYTQTTRPSHQTVTEVQMCDHAGTKHALEPTMPARVATMDRKSAARSRDPTTARNATRTSGNLRIATRT